MPRPRRLQLAPNVAEEKPEIVWIPAAGQTGVLTRDGATFVVSIGCAVPGRMPWWVCGCVSVAGGRSVEFEIEEHETEEEAMALALVFLQEAPVPAELQEPPSPPGGSN